jgi:hypothetical protein
MSIMTRLGRAVGRVVLMSAARMGRAVLVSAARMGSIVCPPPLMLPPVNGVVVETSFLGIFTEEALVASRLRFSVAVSEACDVVVPDPSFIAVVKVLLSIVVASEEARGDDAVVMTVAAVASPAMPSALRSFLADTYRNGRPQIFFITVRYENASYSRLLGEI